MFGNKSLFQLTAERNKQLIQHTIVVGNKDNYLLSQADMVRAGVDEYVEIIEAAPRNTASAIAFAAFSLKSEDIMLITPSDHIITNDEAYEFSVSEAVEFAKNGQIVTFGITPLKAETGYGYIEFNNNEVVSFREKPDTATAEFFLKQKNFLWNSGMFCFQAGVYLEELKTFQPEIYISSLKTWEARTGSFLPENETMQIPSVSVDYAVMENSKRIKVVQTSFGWSDLGSFESIWDHWQQQGEVNRFKQNNCVIGSNKHVEFLGVKELMLVETDDAILVLDKRNSQDVKKIFDRLEREHPNLVN